MAIMMAIMMAIIVPVIAKGIFATIFAVDIGLMRKFDRLIKPILVLYRNGFA